MNATTHQHIRWTDEEYAKIFPVIDSYIELHGVYPTFSNKDAFALFQSKLYKTRQKQSNSKMSFYSLRSKYLDYLSNKNKKSVKLEEKTKHSETVKSVVTKTEPKVYHTKLGEVGLEFFLDAMDSKFVTLYKSVSGLIQDSSKTLPNDIVQAIMSQQTDTNDTIKPVEQKKPIVADVEVEHVITPKDLSRMFTEDEIRAIIREEIESLFGPIKAEPKPITHPEKVNKVVHHVDGNIFNNSPENIKVAPAKENITILVGDDYRVVPVEKTSKYVYVCGLNSNQLQNLKKYFNHEKQIIIDGSENYNHDVKTKAKHADLVLVSKFSSHSTYETLKSSCTESEFDFVSGGMTMIKNRIRSFLNQCSK